MTENYETIRLEVDGEGIAVLTLNRPEVRNALDKRMIDEIRRALRELTEAADVRALIFTGAGDRAFAGGADIAELRDRDRYDALRRINASLFREVESFPAPTIAAIRGWCLGGGCELAISCDLRIAGETSKLGQPEVGVGIIPGAGGTYRLPRLVGLGKARELIFTGRIVEAEEAARIGLVNRIVPDERVLDEARNLAREIARQSPLAVRFAKIALNTGVEIPTEAAMALESTVQAVLFEDEEKHRRMTAFLERKKSKAPGSGPGPGSSSKESS
jgi:enoyl-CoA hydratase